MRQRHPREENEKHRRFIASLPCLICGARDVQAAHVRYADLSVGKEYCGKQEKPDDRFTVPLCIKHHESQHEWNERNWWKLTGIDPIKVALALYSVSGDQARGEMIVNSCREQCAA
jgi:hypothetical protein